MVYRILAAIDNSRLGQLAFETALTLAQSTQAELHLLHVITSEDIDHPAISNASALACGIPNVNSVGFTPGSSDQRCQEYRRAWQHFLQRSMEHLHHLARVATAAGIPADLSQSIGPTGGKICEIAKQQAANLIVMGRQAPPSGLGKWIPGDNSYILHNAPCSVLFVQDTSPACSPGRVYLDTTQADYHRVN